MGKQGSVITTSSVSFTTFFIYHFGGNEQVWPCRHGHVHRGDYAQEGWLECECDHPGVIVLGDDWGMCFDCGKSMQVQLSRIPE